MSDAIIEPCRLTVEAGPEVGRSVRCWLAYDPAHPYEARLIVDEPDEDGQLITWTFARDLLLSGQWRPTGDGDVRIAPLGDSHIAVYLTGYDRDAGWGRYTYSLPASAVRGWVLRAYALVPPGEERVDVDAWLERLGVTS